MICINDFLKGKCDCKSLEEFQTHRDNLMTKMNNLQGDKYKKMQDKLIELNNSRTLHYTDVGMIPFEEQYFKYLEIENDKKLEEQRASDKLNEAVIKLSANIKHVIKLKKLGK